LTLDLNVAFFPFNGACTTTKSIEERLISACYLHAFTPHDPTRDAIKPLSRVTYMSMCHEHLLELDLNVAFYPYPFAHHHCQHSLTRLYCLSRNPIVMTKQASLSMCTNLSSVASLLCWTSEASGGYR
jgi:hypothetical protein